MLTLQSRNRVKDWWTQSHLPPGLIRVFAVPMENPWVLSYLLTTQRRLWSDWTDAQADLESLLGGMSFCWIYWAVAHFSFQCVQYIDEEVLTELVPRLTELIKSGIGVGTKVSIVCWFWCFMDQLTLLRACRALSDNHLTLTLIGCGLLFSRTDKEGIWW